MERSRRPASTHAHTAVHEDAEFAVILNLDQLLSAVGWEGDVQLHPDGLKQSLERCTSGDMAIGRSVRRRSVVKYVCGHVSSVLDKTFHDYLRVHSSLRALALHSIMC